MNWQAVWEKLSIGQRWQAYREFRDTSSYRPGRTLAEFLKLGPYVRCSWVRRIDFDSRGEVMS